MRILSFQLIQVEYAAVLAGQQDYLEASPSTQGNSLLSKQLIRDIQDASSQMSEPPELAALEEQHLD